MIGIQGQFKAVLLGCVTRLDRKFQNILQGIAIRGLESKAAIEQNPVLRIGFRSIGKRSGDVQANQRVTQRLTNLIGIQEHDKRFFASPLHVVESGSQILDSLFDDRSNVG